LPKLDPSIDHHGLWFNNIASFVMSTKKMNMNMF